MKNKARFPLLNLDYVAIREVLNTLDPIDYVNFSKASKSCRLLSTCKKPYKLSLLFSNRPVVWIRTRPITYSVRWTKDRSIDGHFLPKFITYSENPLDNLKEFYLYARSLMDFEIDTVVISMNDFFNEEYWKLVDWIRSNCREIPALHVHGEYPPQGRLQYILDNLKVTGSLKIFVKTIQRLPLRIPNTINELEIRFGFNDTSWTNREINLFYKSWIEMKSHQNLESFEINLTSREDFVAVALRGIPYQMGSPRHFRFNTLLDGSFEVTRKDGLTASVCVYQDRSEFIAVLCTSFFVPTRFFPFYANL